jgi:Flp pilus assembly protein TadD
MSAPETTGTTLPKSKVETGIKLARVQEREGNLRQALTMYEDMLQADPTNGEIYHRLMVVNTRLDQPERADAYFQEAQTRLPNNPELYADYGYACYLRGDMANAETWLKKAHQMEPHNERITGNLALAVGALGRVQESLAYFRQYLDDAEAHANVGFILTQRGDFEAARKSYTKALSLNPSLKSAQHALLQLAEHGEGQPQPAAQESKASAQTKTHWQPTGTASIRS